MTMTIQQEEKVCLFCLEEKKGRKQHIPIEFKGLFPCECVFQSHSQCIIQWQLHCLDELQCPICRVHFILPEEEELVGTLILYQPIDPTIHIGKKFIRFIVLYMTGIFLFFSFLYFLF